MTDTKKINQKLDTVFLEIDDAGAVILSIQDSKEVFEGAYSILRPDEALAISEQMARYAYTANTGMTPQTKSIKAEMIKTKMVTRCSLVIKNLLDRKKEPLYIANEIVDIILSEAL